ncbi:AraC-like DNA-binding protein [Mucilaginibacter frigoritolerans]|uniref:AraC-like DNA-binding protein n=1 Tax=Mucilaginibacter frigoritolerans TaxID=652788 RepID=A0A562UDI7_9SPHI|nr:AraC family transcriptional regulator [Mucilaginibacter frigoritolerans]TWJ03171.1 AraC-like DNA-binding protein [Mucilaginibacter frigoritolerans]
MKTSVNKTCLIGPAIKPEQFIAEHLFFYLVNGSMSGYYGGETYTLKSGEYGIVRKNRLGRMDSAKENHQAEKIIFVFDEPFLKKFQDKYKFISSRIKSDEPFLRMGDNELIPNLIRSLKPYFDLQGQIDKAFFELKREELLLILLKLRPELSGVFFDYRIPGKIDLEEFMERNYKFNVSIERFAYLTGRSVSAFKRDFKTVFNQTPNRWLVKKRLHEAYFLIERKNERASEIYQDLGFEALSHFSFAFKKLFNLTPTELAGQKKDVN